MTNTNSKVKHTPGPWFLGTDMRQIEAESGVVVAVVSGVVSNASVIGDAHLIAAAPDLLEALEAAIGYIPDADLAVKARAAIKKARGEQ